MWHAPRMRLTLIAAVMVVGCSYDEPTVGPGNPGGDDQPGPEAGGGVPRTCPSDAALRLCVDFDGVPTVIDEMSHTVQAMNVAATTRQGDPAARVDASSQIFIPPAGASDLDNITDLTIEMWIAPDQRPPPGQTFWMLDNNTEYGMEYLDDGKVHCFIANHPVDSMTTVHTRGGFVLVACT